MVFKEWNHPFASAQLCWWFVCIFIFLFSETFNMFFFNPISAHRLFIHFAHRLRLITFGVTAHFSETSQGVIGLGSTWSPFLLKEIYLSPFLACNHPQIEVPEIEVNSYPSLAAGGWFSADLGYPDSWRVCSLVMDLLPKIPNNFVIIQSSRLNFKMGKYPIQNIWMGTRDFWDDLLPIAG